MKSKTTLFRFCCPAATRGSVWMAPLVILLVQFDVGCGSAELYDEEYAENGDKGPCRSNRLSGNRGGAGGAARTKQGCTTPTKRIPPTNTNPAEQTCKNIDENELAYPDRHYQLCPNGDPLNHGDPLSIRMYTIVDADATTCKQVAQKLRGIDTSDQVKDQLRTTYQETCCNPACTPPTITVESWPEPDIPGSDVERWYKMRNQCHVCPPDPDLAWSQVPRGVYFDNTTGEPKWGPPWAVNLARGGTDNWLNNRYCQELYYMGYSYMIQTSGCALIRQHCSQTYDQCWPPEPMGRHDPCDFCQSGLYPLNNNFGVTAQFGQFGIDANLIPLDSNPFENLDFVRSPANPTCGDLYWLGRAGHLSENACNVLNNNSGLQEACACNEMERLTANGL